MEIINKHQQLLYEKYEKDTALEDLRLYKKVLDKYRNYDKLRILDIGGAGGNFALALSSFFDKETEIFVLDNSEYATWQNDEYRSKVNFINGSVENLNSIFKDDKTFDLIFTNRVFHHFVGKSWKETLNGMDDVLKKIRHLLAKNGTLCIKDHFYNGMFHDKLASFIIFSMTTCKIPWIAKLMQKNGAHSAGVGVCFQSEKMWFERIKKNGFLIDDIDIQPYMHLTPVKRFLLLCKKYSLDNNIYVKIAN